AGPPREHPSCGRCRMSVTGITTLAVVLVGGAGCWFSYSASQASQRRDSGPGSAEDLSALHLQIAELHRQRGDVEAADRHTRFAAAVVARRRGGSSAAGWHEPAVRDHQFNDDDAAD